MTTLAPKLPWSHAHSGGFPRLGGQALPTDADAIDYLNRVKAADGGVGVEVGVAQAIDAFVKGCKSDSANYAGDPTRTNWDALKACCVMAGARTISGALVPLKGTAPTAQGGWTSNEYSRGGSTPGLKGNGTTLYLDTNRAGNADGQNDNHVAVYATVNAYTGVKAYYGATLNAIGAENAYDADVTLQGFRSRSNSAKTLAVTPTTGLVGASRSSASEFTARTAGNSTLFASVSQAPQSETFGIFTIKTSGSPSFTNDCRLSYYSIGSACDLAALDSRTTHLMNSIRFTLLTGLSPDYDPATLAYLLAAYTAGGSLA